MQNLTSYLNIFSGNDFLMLAIAVVLVLSLRIFKRQRIKQQEQLLSMQLLQRDMRALANAAIGVGGRVLEIERQQRKAPITTSDEITQADVPQQTQQASSLYNQAAPIEYYNPSNQPYEQAIRMALSGASTDDIVNICGLSKSEAELVSVMHRMDKAS